MDAREYIVAIRRGKSIEDLKPGNKLSLTDYVKSLRLEVIKTFESGKSVRIRATDEQLANMWDSLGKTCQITMPVKGVARTAGTS